MECICCPGVVELVRSNLGTSFPLFHDLTSLRWGRWGWGLSRWRRASPGSWSACTPSTRTPRWTRTASPSALQILILFYATTFNHIIAQQFLIQLLYSFDVQNWQICRTFECVPSQFTIINLENLLDQSVLGPLQRFRNGCEFLNVWKSSRL